MSFQFKFKPDKIKYLTTIDTLDSSHKKIVKNINKKKDDVSKKEKKLVILTNELNKLDYSHIKNENYTSDRAKLIDEITFLKEEINKIENYEDELEYYEKTHEILFNYYDIVDGHKMISNNVVENETLVNMTSDDNNITQKNASLENFDFSDIKTNKIDEFFSEVDVKTDKNNDWDFDGIEIFSKTNEPSKLDLLNQMSKLKRKEKKTTKKRVKNVETLIKDSNNIMDYLEGKHGINNQNNINTNTNNDNVQKFDRASLFEDYKILLEGYNSQKKIDKPCLNCGPTVNKVLMYSDGIYVCLNCGEVEKCIIEHEVTNYKDPMIEKPTFPYKRKNHFCEWIKVLLFEFC